MSQKNACKACNFFENYENCILMAVLPSFIFITSCRPSDSTASARCKNWTLDCCNVCVGRHTIKLRQWKKTVWRLIWYFNYYTIFGLGTRSSFVSRNKEIFTKILCKQEKQAFILYVYIIHKTLSQKSHLSSNEKKKILVLITKNSETWIKLYRVL